LILAVQPTLNALVEPLETTGVSLLYRIYRARRSGRTKARWQCAMSGSRPMPLFQGAASKSSTRTSAPASPKRYFEKDIEAAEAAARRKSPHS